MEFHNRSGVGDLDERLEQRRRDIPGENGDVGSGLSPFLQFSGSKASDSLVQNNAASPLLKLSQNNSHGENNDIEQLLFTPIKMLDFNDLDDGDQHVKGAPPASLSKSSTPNPKSASKRKSVISPEHSVVLPVGEMEASPILADDYAEKDMEREIEQRLMEAGRLGEESTSDRGSRERSPVIDGAENEDTLQTRFQLMQAGSLRPDPRIRAPQKQITVPSKLESSNEDSSQLYPIRVGPNHGNAGLVNYKISRPACPQGQAENDTDTQGFQVPRLATNSPRQAAYAQHPSSNTGGDGLTADRQLGFTNSFIAKGSNFLPPTFGPFSTHQQSSLPLFNQNQSAHTDRDRQLNVMTSNKTSSVGGKSLDFPEAPGLPPVELNHYFLPQIPTGFNQGASQPPMTGDLFDLNQSDKDMDEVWGHLRKVIKQGQAIVEGTEASDRASDLLTGPYPSDLQGHGSQGHTGLDFSPHSQGSVPWFDGRSQGRGDSGPQRMEDLSRQLPDNTPSRYQSDPTLVAENRYLKEIVEKERYRRKHCENHIHQLNAKLLEAQQQLAVVIAQDRRKDSMVEQLDKQFAQVVEGWRRKETEMEESVKQLKTEKFQLGEAMEVQTETLRKFENELSGVVRELQEERQTAAINTDKLKTQLSEQSRELTSLNDVLTTERDKVNLMTSEWEHEKEGRSQAEVKLQHLQEQMHQEQDNWYKREKELLQKLDELTDSHLKAVQEERNRTEEKSRLVQDVEQQLKIIMTEMNKLEIDLDAAIREKESLKVAMSLNEAKAENSLKMLETDLKSEFEHTMQQKMAEVRKSREELEQKFSERLRLQVEELTNQHQAEMREKNSQFECLMKEAETEALRKIHDLEERLNQMQTENSSLKSKKHKLEIQRTEVLSKLQLLMQSQWNEALSLLGTASPNRADQNLQSKSQSGHSKSTPLTTSNILSGLNLSILSQPSGFTSANTTLTENSATTPTRENILSLINSSLHQPSSQNSQTTFPWQQTSGQQNQKSTNSIGQSAPAENIPSLFHFNSHNERSQTVDGTNSLLSKAYSNGEGSHLQQPQHQMGQNDERMSHAGSNSTWFNPPHSQSKPAETSITVNQQNNGNNIDMNKLYSRLGQLDLRQQQHGISTIKPNPSSQTLNNNFNNSRLSTSTQQQGLLSVAGDFKLPGYPGNRPHGNRGNKMASPDVSMISSIHDTTTTSHVNSTLDSVNHAVPIRPPQQRSRQTNGSRSSGRNQNVRSRQGQNMDNYSPSSARESDDLTHRLREGSDETGSYTDNHSEEEAGPRRLEFSPPTKQPRSPGVRLSDHSSLDEQHSESVLEQSLRLNEQYSDISEKLDHHESRQSELQHYIQMLLQRSPGSPTSQEPQDFQNTTASIHPNQSAVVSRDVDRSHNRSELKGQTERKQPNPHAVLKTTQQKGGLQLNQLEEISRLLSVYGSQEGQQGGNQIPQSPPTTQLLHLLQNLHQNGANNQQEVDQRPVRQPSNQNHRQSVRQDKGRKANPNKPSAPSNNFSKCESRSSSSDRTSSMKNTVAKRPERKPTSGPTQSKNSVPKWK